MTLRTTTLFIICTSLCYSLLAFQAEAWPDLQLEKLSINTPAPESNPQLSPDNQHLYFTRNGHSQNIGRENLGDSWRTFRLPDGKWSRAINLGSPINNRLTNSVIGLNQSNDIIYLNNSHPSNKNQSIAFARKEGRSWGNPKEMPIEDFYNLHPQSFFQVDLKGRVLLISAQREEGQGERDLYVSFRKEGHTWGKPKNLGPVINTIRDESAAFIAADGQTLYFVSNGHPGIGGKDIYMCIRLDDSWTKWSKPQNLGTGINTSLDESSIAVATTGKYAVLTRTTSNGAEDLYEVQLPKALQPLPVTLVTGSLLNHLGQPINGKLEFRNLEQQKVKETFQTQLDGQYQMILPYGTKGGIFADIEGYFPLSNHLQFSSQDLEELDFDQYNLLSILQNEEDYRNGSREIENLQLKLQTLDQELTQLQKERSAFVLIRRDSLPVKKKKEQANPESKKEVEAMKKKFKKHYKTDQKLPKATEEEDEFIWAVEEELVNEIYKEMKDSLDEESVKQLELKENQLKAQIKASFNSTNRMKEDIKNALRTEIKYQTKKGVEEEWQQELDSKVQKQIERENQWISKGGASNNAPKSYSNSTSIPPSYQKVQKDFSLVPIEQGQLIPLHNIFFKPNTAEFKPTSFTELNRLAEFLSKHPDLELEIGGHTNGWIGHSLALELSTKRAQKVADFLIKEGIASKRISSKGYGKTRPIASNETLEGRRLNQRIELKILKI